MKHFIFVLIFSFASLFLIPSLYNITESQSVDISEEAVVYQLPYPGLLPDHPLYFFKQIRDNVLLFTTRDNGKKAVLLLQISDKHMASALALTDKGREQLAQEQLIRGEERFLQIPPLLMALKEQGGSYPADLVMDLYESNKKHREVITDVMKKSTETEISALENLLQMNLSAKESLDNL